MYETKKTRLDIEKIEDEKRMKIIFPATFEDVKKYDVKTQRLIEKIERVERSRAQPKPRASYLQLRLWSPHRRRTLILILSLVGLLLITIVLIGKFKLW